MATSSVSYSFVNGTTGDGTQVNQNFTDLVNFLNNQVVHKDGSTTMTGALTLPASDPVSANQAARKAYVDTVGNTGIKVFASTAARDAAITSPIDGQFCYVNSGDAAEGLWSYNGSAWRKGPGWNAPWGVIAYANSSSAGTSSASTSFVDEGLVTGSVTTVANRLLRVSYTVHAYAPSGTVAAGSFQVLDTGSSTGLAVIQAPAVSNTYATTYSAVSRVTSVAGVRTWKLQQKVIAGGGTMQSYASGAQTRELIVEDIGPSGAPV